MSAPTEDTQRRAAAEPPARPAARSLRAVAAAFQRSGVAASIIAVMLVIGLFNICAFPYLNGPGFAFGEDRTRATRAGLWFIRPQDPVGAVRYVDDFTNRRVREQMEFASDRIRAQMVYLHLAELSPGRHISTYPDSDLEPIWFEALARMTPRVHDYDPQISSSEAAALSTVADRTVQVEEVVFRIIVGMGDDMLYHLVHGDDHFFVSESIMRETLSRRGSLS